MLDLSDINFLICYSISAQWHLCRRWYTSCSPLNSPATSTFHNLLFRRYLKRQSLFVSHNIFCTTDLC